MKTVLLMIFLTSETEIILNLMQNVFLKISIVSVNFTKDKKKRFEIAQIHQEADQSFSRTVRL